MAEALTGEMMEDGGGVELLVALRLSPWFSPLLLRGVCVWGGGIRIIPSIHPWSRS